MPDRHNESSAPPTGPETLADLIDATSHNARRIAARVGTDHIGLTDYARLRAIVALLEQIAPALCERPSEYLDLVEFTNRDRPGAYE